MASSEGVLGGIVIGFEPELGDLGWIQEIEGLFKDWVLSESGAILRHLSFY